MEALVAERVLLVGALIITEGPVGLLLLGVYILLGQRLLQHLLVLLGKLRQFCQFYTAQHHPLYANGFIMQYCTVYLVCP